MILTVEAHEGGPVRDPPSSASGVDEPRRSIALTNDRVVEAVGGRKHPSRLLGDATVTTTDPTLSDMRPCSKPTQSAEELDIGRPSSPRRSFHVETKGSIM